MEKILEGVQDVKRLLQEKDEEIESVKTAHHLVEEEIRQLRLYVVDAGVVKTELELRIATLEQEIETYKSEIKGLQQIKNKHYPVSKTKKLFDWF